MREVRLGLLGCGTVGLGVLNVLKNNGTDIQARLGASIVIKRICVSDTSKTRDVMVDRSLLTNNAQELIDDPDIDIIVEMIGGIEPARRLIAAALNAGKHVVTANKALLAHHGPELFKLAEESKLDINFEASVGGGIPVIRAVRESLASDRITAITAIINGTSNYILSRMSDASLSYQDALAEAQQLGYAEADPTMDVGGFDAAQKLSILVTLATGMRVDYREFDTRSLATLDYLDVEYGREFGYTIKPLALARFSGDEIEARVMPVFVPQRSLLASISGAFNAVKLNSYALGPMLLYGQGAGMLPTAVSVMSDVIEVARNVLTNTYGRLPHMAFHDHYIRDGQVLAKDAWQSSFYLRFSVVDQPGVLSTITGVLGEKKISIYQMVQKNPGGSRPVQVVIFTHKARHGAIRECLQFLDGLDLTVDATQYIPVEDTL